MPRSCGTFTRRSGAKAPTSPAGRATSRPPNRRARRSEADLAVEAAREHGAGGCAGRGPGCEGAMAHDVAVDSQCPAPRAEGAQRARPRQAQRLLAEHEEVAVEEEQLHGEHARRAQPLQPADRALEARHGDEDERRADGEAEAHEDRGEGEPAAADFRAPRVRRTSRSKNGLKIPTRNAKGATASTFLRHEAEGHVAQGRQRRREERRTAGAPKSRIWRRRRRRREDEGGEELGAGVEAVDQASRRRAGPAGRCRRRRLRSALTAASRQSPCRWWR